MSHITGYWSWVSFFTCIKVLISHETEQNIPAGFFTPPCKVPYWMTSEHILFEKGFLGGMLPTPQLLHGYACTTMASPLSKCFWYHCKFHHGLCGQSTSDILKKWYTQYLNMVIILATTFMYESNALLCVQLFTLCVWHHIMQTSELNLPTKFSNLKMCVHPLPSSNPCMWPLVLGPM